MKSFLKKYRHLIIGVLVGGIAVAIISEQTAEKRLDLIQETLESSLELNLSESKQLAKVIGEGGATTEVQQIIPNCTFEEQNTFDSSLNGLDSSLSISELQKLDAIFARCAPIQSIRRAVMVMELNKKIQNFEVLVLQRKQVGAFSNYDKTISDLKELQKAEEVLTQLSFDLVYLQREIIDTLLSGEKVDSELAISLKQNGQSIRQKLNSHALITKQIRDSVLN